MVDEPANGDCGRTTGTETQEEKEEVEIANGLGNMAPTEGLPAFSMQTV